MSGSDAAQVCDRARERLHQRDLAAAKELFTQAVTLDPDCCDAHEGLATCAYLVEDYPTAIAEFLRLTMLQPMESRHLTNLGAIHNRMGEHMKAADYLRKAIARNKKCAESFYNLGIAQRKLKQNTMAISAYKEAIKLAPNMAEAYQNLGNVYVDMGNLLMAITNFEKALEIRPTFEKARAGLQKAQQQLNEAKSRNNQMGRLEAMSSTVHTVAPVITRELTDEERWEDRKCVKSLADEIERLAKDCVEHLKQGMIPAILEVERAMGHGADEAILLTQAADQLRTATSKWATLRRSLKRKVGELQDHEQQINEPVAKS